MRLPMFLAVFLSSTGAFAHCPCEAPQTGQLGSIQQIWQGELVAFDPEIMATATGYDMIYTDAVQEVATALIQSADGLSWAFADTPHPQDGIILDGGNMAVETADMVLVNGTHYLYHSTYDPGAGPIEGLNGGLHLATSTDGVTFTTHPSNPIIPRDANTDAYWAADVQFINGIFMMFVSRFGNDGQGNPGVWIDLTYSSDGINWLPPAQVMGTGMPGLPSWGQSELFNSSTFWHEDRFVMVLNGANADDHSAIGLATSFDTVNWTFAEEPLLEVEPGTFYETSVVGPTHLIENDVLRVWFGGYREVPWSFSLGYGEVPLADVLP